MARSLGRLRRLPPARNLPVRHGTRDGRLHHYSGHVLVVGDSLRHAGAAGGCHGPGREDEGNDEVSGRTHGWGAC